MPPKKRSQLGAKRTQFKADRTGFGSPYVASGLSGSVAVVENSAITKRTHREIHNGLWNMEL